MAGGRTGWTGKSTSYRSRLIGAGKSGKLSGRPMTASQVRSYWERGGDLRGGRSHPRPRPSYAPPEEASKLAQTGLQDTDSMEQLRKWRKRGPPWLPKDRSIMADDTAAILSEIRFPRSEWKKVLITEHPEGSGVYVMKVTPRRGYAQEVVIADRETIREIGAFINHLYVPPGTSKRKQAEMEAAFKRLKTEVEVNIPGSGTERVAA